MQGLQQFLKIPLKPSRNCVETKPNTEAKPPQNYREKKNQTDHQRLGKPTVNTTRNRAKIPRKSWKAAKPDESTAKSRQHSVAASSCHTSAAQAALCCSLGYCTVLQLGLLHCVAAASAPAATPVQQPNALNVKNPQMS